jgi:hypothetical protein
MTEVRKAYVHTARADGLGGRTPPAEVEPSALSVVEAWNDHIPIGKVRVVTTLRFCDLRAALAVFSRDEIVAAIQWYSLCAWNRSRRAWKTFDHFVSLENLTPLVERAAEAAERAEAIAEQRAKTAGLSTVPSTEYSARRAFDALPLDSRRQYVERAGAGMISRSPGLGSLNNPAAVLAEAMRLFLEDRR